MKKKQEDAPKLGLLTDKEIEAFIARMVTERQCVIVAWSSGPDQSSCSMRMGPPGAEGMIGQALEWMVEAFMENADA